MSGPAWRCSSAPSPTSGCAGAPVGRRPSSGCRLPPRRTAAQSRSRSPSRPIAVAVVVAQSQSQSYAGAVSMSADAVPATPATGASALSGDDEHPIGHRHRDVTGGWLRPAVFGAAGGVVSAHQIGLTGLAGLVAGAFSMATGEYTSVASQTELTQAEIEIEKAELKRSPRAEEAELASLYMSRGLDEPLAREVARQLSADHETAWRVHTREELGVDPDDLPRPMTAAWSSFCAFALGALLPLLPYLLGAHSLLPALLLAGLGLFAAGAFVSRFTRRTALSSGARQLLFGAAAAAVTYAIGHLVGGRLG